MGWMRAGLLASLILLSANARGAESANDFARAQVQAVYPGIDRFGPITGDPPTAAIYAKEKLVGYVFSSLAVIGSTGYSGKPLDILIGLDLKGRLTGARLIAHQEPILVIGVATRDLDAFVSQFRNVDIRNRIDVGGPSKPDRVGIDAVSGATVSSFVIADAILRSARKVARAKGILDGGGGTRIDIDKFKAFDWPGLIAFGGIVRRRITNADVDRQLMRAGAGKSKNRVADASFIDLYSGLVTPAMVGLNLLGQRAYNRLLAERRIGEHFIFIGASGLYSFKGTAYRATGIFDRIQIVQGTRTIRLTDGQHIRLDKLALDKAPELREMAYFRLPYSTGFNPARPWRLELLITRPRSDASLAVARFTLAYKTPPALVVGSAATARTGRPLWMRIWIERAASIVVLLVALLALTAILFFQDQIEQRPELYRGIRFAFLGFTLVWLGWMAGAQLSVVHVLSFAQALLIEFHWELFLLEPLIFILWSYVAVTMLFWGRGVFCGWLCPFGALQDLSNRVAKALKVPQLALPWGLHERLWPIKYVLFLGIFAISLGSISLAVRGAEIEPFKTAIVLHFMRAWPYVLFVVLLLAAGLFVERIFCRYLCPLGAALALPARMRMFEWLKRRPECGRPCQTCAVLCTVQAIHPDGRINPNECIHCLHCQIVYYDDKTCPPLIERRKRRARRRARASDGMAGTTPPGATT